MNPSVSTRVQGTVWYPFDGDTARPGRESLPPLLQQLVEDDASNLTNTKIPVIVCAHENV